MPELLAQILLPTGWEDITSDLRESGGAVIKRGRPDEAAQVDPGELTATLNNRGGRYSVRNPESDLFGSIGRYTPMGVWVRGPDRFMRPTVAGGRATVAATTAMDVTADLDVRLELALYSIPALDAAYQHAVTELAGRYVTSGDQRSWRLLLDNRGVPSLSWSTDGTLAGFREVSATAPLPYRPEERFALRATLDVNNGAGGHVVAFYHAASLDDTWEPLGQAVTGAGTTSIKAGTTAPLEVGSLASLAFVTGHGRYYGAELRNGIGGPVVAEFDATVLPAGTTAWTDSVGRSWTLAGGSTITDWYPRALDEVVTWPDQWDTSGNDAWVNVTAAGPLRRRSTGQKPLESTLRRRIPSADPAPLAYWPMEDGSAATSAASGLPGGQPLTLTNVRFAADSSLPSSAPLPTLADGGATTDLVGAVPGAAAGGWHAEMVYRLDTMPATERTMLRLYLAGASGGVTAVRVRISTAGIRVQALDIDDNVVAFALFTDPAAIASFTGGWNRLALFSYQSGGSCFVRAAWRDVGAGTYNYAGTVWSGSTVGRVVQVRGVWGTDFQGAAIGHLAVWDVGGTGTTSPGVTIYDGADDGYSGEETVARMRRLAAELRWKVTAPGIAGDSEPLGPQRTITAPDLLREAADADGGLLYELRGSLGALHYIRRRGRYNPRPAVILDYSAGEVWPPFTPRDDDAGVRNSIVVRRPGGSASAPAERTTGRLSTAEPPDGMGLIDEDIELNLAGDEQLDGRAYWRLHQRAWDDARWPQVTINLANPRAASLRQEILDGLDVGAVIQILNPPEGRPPGPYLLEVASYTETLDAVRWTITANCLPAGPWAVATTRPDILTADTPPHRVDTALSTLATGIDTDDMSLSVATNTAAGGLTWTTTPTHYPLDIEIGGERMTISGITGSSSPQTFTVAQRSVNGIVKSHPAGAQVRLAPPTPVIGL
ncbi:hypothetical protein [Streptomyces sp. URMC 129]|uniref:hypothetical protein n=1 Tax=Streptomyces sp. URMC 129 TaxID=3423407 RepID=UPI003F1D0795